MKKNVHWQRDSTDSDSGLDKGFMTSGVSPAEIVSMNLRLGSAQDRQCKGMSRSVVNE